MKLWDVWTQKRRTSLCAQLALWHLQRSPFPSSPPAPHQKDLLPLHAPCECLAKVPHQMFSCWQLPAFHRSFGSHMVPSVQGLLSNPAAPFRPITSTWTHSSGAFPVPTGSFDSFHSLSLTSKFFFELFTRIFLLYLAENVTPSRWRTAYKSGSIRSW